MNRSGQRAVKKSGQASLGTSTKPRKKLKKLSAKQASLPTPRPKQHAPLAASATRIRSAALDAKQAANVPPAMSDILDDAVVVLERDEGSMSEAQAELSRMISELNEVRMRLDAIVRKLAESAMDVAEPTETVDDVEQVRMRLLGKLDRIRERLVTRLSEERIAARDR
jgi:hypothetical protein